jgi:hypothetical protein
VNQEVQLDKALAHGTLRLSLGISSLMHGLVRLLILTTFAADVAQNFVTDRNKTSHGLSKLSSQRILRKMFQRERHFSFEQAR